MKRQKAPTITPTGCPMCGRGGIPGTSCAACVLRLHGEAVRRAEADRARELRAALFPSHELLNMLRSNVEDARAAWVGAELLLDALGVLLVRVRFEVPAHVDVARDVRR